jgi:hypothetical protein
LPGAAKAFRSIRSTCRSDALDQSHTLIAGEDGSFRNLRREDQLVLKGKAGTRASDQDYSIFVAQLKARPGTQFG